MITTLHNLQYTISCIFSKLFAVSGIEPVMLHIVIVVSLSQPLTLLSVWFSCESKGQVVNPAIDVHNRTYVDCINSDGSSGGVAGGSPADTGAPNSYCRFRQQLQTCTVQNVALVEIFEYSVSYLIALQL